MERVIGRTLAAAAAAAAVILIAGVASWLLAGTPTPPERRDVATWWAVGPLGLIGAGLLLVTFTPIVELAAALGAFALVRERRYAWATATVLAVLLASVVGAALVSGAGR
ncbi:MAG: DUF1634 domain-containing protein [Candidatus Limnocylindria bacterium]